MEREERRKRIMARGTDRLALITGRIDAIDPNLSKASSFSSAPPPIDPVSAMHTRSSSEPVVSNDKPLVFQDNSHHGGDGEPNTPPRQDDHGKIVSEEITSSGNRVSTLQKVNENEELPNVPDNANSPEKPFVHNLITVTPKEINFSIITSEDTRVLCSVVVAIFVVLSNANIPHNAVKSKSLIAYRPLYVILLTDVLIVAARLALFVQYKEEVDKDAKIEENEGGNWGGAVKLLEWGLVIHQAIRAIFIDCSFYVVIVVCGLSLL